MYKTDAELLKAIKEVWLPIMEAHNNLARSRFGKSIASTILMKCECGAEKAKTIGHSHWCPKYERT